MQTPKYLLVETAVLPDVFLKVVETKRLLAAGGAKNLTEAVRKCGLSRSTFYKYKDSVMTPADGGVGGIVNLYMTLLDKPGILSGVMGEISSSGLNIVTVNQNIPVDGVAMVSISARISGDGENFDIEEKLKGLDGVIEVKRVLGD